MKILSIIFTTLLGFISISYAEDVYTITPKYSSGEEAYVYLDLGQEHIKQEFVTWSIYSGDYLRSVEMYKLEHDKCLQLTADQFNSLFVLGVIQSHLCHLVDSDCLTIPPNHYEIYSESGNFHYVNYTNQPNMGCTDITEWMTIKRQEYFMSNR